jgi:hypothetical protein
MYESNVFIMKRSLMKIRRYLLLNLTQLKIGLCIMYIYVHMKVLFKNYKNFFTDFLSLVTFCDYHLFIIESTEI